ncbi:hypothetical protein GmHk_12G034391 [Glycine max]|nr:hypothetical protein GmHk_12G034391 [Glycine max]
MKMLDMTYFDSTYKTNKCRFSLLDIVGVTPKMMTFSAIFGYLEREHLFLRRDALPRIIVTDRDLALINAVKTVFPETTNLLCRFHIDKNVKSVKPWLVKKMHEIMIEYAHWALKRLLQNSLGDLCITLYNKLLGMVSRYALNQIVTEFERVHYASAGASSIVAATTRC